MAVIAYRQFAQTFLRSMAVKKVPVTQAVKFMRKQGISFRYTEMLRSYRTYAKVGALKDRYKYIPKKYRVPEKMFGTPHEFQSKKYLYEGVFRLKNRETGKIFLKPSRLPSNYHLTPTQITERSIKISEEGFEGYNWEILDYGLTGAFKEQF